MFGVKANRNIFANFKTCTFAVFNFVLRTIDLITCQELAYLLTFQPLLLILHFVIPFSQKYIFQNKFPREYFCFLIYILRDLQTFRKLDSNTDKTFGFGKSKNYTPINYILVFVAPPIILMSTKIFQVRF